MNGADTLCDVLLANKVDVCFANPGTSEMHFVAALDRKPQMRCILGLFEGVVTAAADGYGRMADRPAATLLHLGPGLANGLANLHNARRARTPMINIVGDHATFHLEHDAPLTTDIESLARPMSQWVGRVADAQDVRRCTEAAYLAAMRMPGISTMILPADAAWTNVTPGIEVPIDLPPLSAIAPEKLRAAADLLRGRKAAIILGGKAMRGEALRMAGRIAKARGIPLFSHNASRMERGAGRVAVRPIPYNVDQAVRTLAGFEAVVCIGARSPVAFFAYPGKPGTLLPTGCAAVELAGDEHDYVSVLEELTVELGVAINAPFDTNSLTTRDLPLPSGKLDPDTLTMALARFLPENAILCDESISSAGRMAELAPFAPPHDLLRLTGGAIGIGIPLSVGAAVACPDRKVIVLQADGSGMYTAQGLWTQARENLDILTIVLANRGYSILKGEMRNVGVNEFGRNARLMLEVDNPAIDWCSLAKGMGVEAGRAETVEEFVSLLRAGMARRGPFLIEAVL
ncbi:acetolactate synthase large subunit [Aquamicrobium ahrensii]|uniref:acetolactate synthase large subunit n=1 Tax=Aquamicrobium ahrensii TaxID=469551 RepID=UPI003395C6C8